MLLLRVPHVITRAAYIALVTDLKSHMLLLRVPHVITRAASLFNEKQKQRKFRHFSQ